MNNSKYKLMEWVMKLFGLVPVKVEKRKAQGERGGMTC